ncbi:MAG: transposase-like protein [Cryomorphaceae bacterium]|jgi:transposase-like protein
MRAVVRAYSLSYRDLEDLMQERGYEVDHSAIQRWVVYYARASRRRFVRTKNGLAIAGGLMKRILKSKASGNISIEPSTKKAALSISY